MNLSPKKIVLFLVSMSIVVIAFLISCNKEKDPYVVNAPAPFPKLPATPYQYLNNSNLATLGRVLFYDRNLSLNNIISCGSCHKQELAFSDNKAFSHGLFNELTARNTLPIVNSFSHKKFWDGRAGNFDTAVFMPVMNKVEMNMFDLNILPQKLSLLSYYPNLFKLAFGANDITLPKIRIALAGFLYNFISGNSKFDKGTLNAEEKEGKDIFYGKGKCRECHSGGNFNGYSTRFENIGLDLVYADQGRAKISLEEKHNGLFAVPTLRNIALTAPYMHDGRFRTLREVIDHYNSGVRNHRNLSYQLKDIEELLKLPKTELLLLMDTNHDGDITEEEAINFLSTKGPGKLNLTEHEKEALEAFLNTLTDNTFITDPKLSNPF